MDNDGLQLTEYIKRNGWIVLRMALPDSDSESWPSKWYEKYDEKIPDNWRDMLSENYCKDDFSI
jgi:hypothetical protein